jgi:hypothetical protein
MPKRKRAAKKRAAAPHRAEPLSIEQQKGIFAEKLSSLGALGLKEDDERRQDLLLRIQRAATEYQILSRVRMPRRGEVIEQLLAVEEAASGLGRALIGLSHPSLEWLLDGRTSYALPSESGEPLESYRGYQDLRNCVFRAELAENDHAGAAEVLSRHLMFKLADGLREKAFGLSELAREARQAFGNAWPSEDKGGRASRLAGSPDQRLAESLEKTIFDVLGRSAYRKISGATNGSFHKLLKAVAESATGEKSADNAFSEVLKIIAKKRNKTLGLADPTTCLEDAAKERAEERGRKEAARVLSEAERILKSPLPTANDGLETYQADIERLLPRLRAYRAYGEASKMEADLVSRNKDVQEARREQSKKWVQKLSAIRSGQPR